MIMKNKANVVLPISNKAKTTATKKKPVIALVFIYNSLSVIIPVALEALSS